MLRTNLKSSGKAVLLITAQPSSQALLLILNHPQDFQQYPLFILYIQNVYLFLVSVARHLLPLMAFSKSHLCFYVTLDLNFIPLLALKYCLRYILYSLVLSSLAVVYLSVFFFVLIFIGNHWIYWIYKLSSKIWSIMTFILLNTLYPRAM